MPRAIPFEGVDRFDKCSLHALLTNIIYAGKIRHKDQIYDGQHEPIINQSVFDKVQTKLKEQRVEGFSDCSRLAKWKSVAKRREKFSKILIF